MTNKLERGRLLAQLRQVPASSLDVHFGPTYPLTYVDSNGRLRFVKNALDRLMHVQGMGYDDAVSWLVEHGFGTGEGIAVAEADAGAENAVQSAVDRRIVAQLRQVSAAVGCPLQVFAFDPDTRNHGYEIFPPGKSENSWTAEDWVRGLPVLKAKNLNRLGIYAFPAKSVTDRALVIVDDIMDGKREPTVADSYVKTACPNIYMHTSDAKTQGVFVVPGDPRRGSDDYRAILWLAKAENIWHGDPGINNVRHAFRLPGFFNTKDKYREKPPLVRIIGTPHAGPSEYILRQLDAAREAVKAEENVKKACKPTSVSTSPSPR